MKRRIKALAIGAIAILLLVVLSMDFSLMYRQIRQQTKDAGVSQLENISRELEESIRAAESLTMEIAIESREVLDDRDALKTFLYEKKAEVVKGNTGAFNVYMAGEDWSIIPDFVAPDDYVAQKRLWYKGALQSGGKAYVSSPYQDAMTGDICYTVSVMLGDGKTVISVDYTMDTIQTYVEQIRNEGIHYAVIATDDGIIAGCMDQAHIGEQLTSVMPEVTGIWSLSKRSDDYVTTRIKADFLYENLFATKSGNGWILIVSINDWDLYHTSYIQLLVTILLLAALFVVAILTFYFSKKSKKRAGEDVLQRKEFHETRSKQETRHINKRYRNRILAFMLVVMIFSLYTIISATYRWGNTQLQNEAKKYEYNLSKWIDTQKSILDMFVSTIAANPEMLEDYEGTIRYLDGVTDQFSEISVTYMTNPELTPTVYMNNGWLPDPSWKVEERPWYVGAMESKTGWSMTAPYYDEQTGGYCVTISEQVFSAKTGKFLGVFGIDFYMDKLIGIMGDSYSNEGYAFLVDTEGNIINHPYGKYQMSQDSQTSVLELPYGKVKMDGQDMRIFRDYDGSLRTLLASVDETSRFSIFVVSDALPIYGRVLLYGSICLAAFLVCIVMIYRLLSGMIAWQDEVNRRLEKAAQTDGMTGLLNKASAEEAISEAVKQVPGALLVMDLDNFKLVNDLYSHKMGDRLLVRFAKLIQSVTRENDIAGRIGGDEFAVFCEGLTDENTIVKKTAFLNNEIVKSAREYMGSDMEIPLGCSTGVAMVPQAGRDYGILFAKADLALHEIKKSGKHDVRIYRDQKVEQSESSGSDLFNLRVIFGERNPKQSALVADREQFQNVYRSMVRLSSANGWDLHLIEFTLEAKDEKTLPAGMKRFMGLAEELLRGCDVIMQYNGSQVIVLIMEPEGKDYLIPVNRILDAWKQEGNPEITVTFKQEQVTGNG